MVILLTWDEVYKLADGAACGDPELRRKDNARYEIRNYILGQEGHNIDEDECPEDSIDYYIATHGGAYKFMFDELGGSLYVGF